MTSQDVRELIGLGLVILTFVGIGCTLLRGLSWFSNLFKGGKNDKI